jgi:ribonuclease Z
VLETLKELAARHQPSANEAAPRPQLPQEIGTGPRIQKYDPDTKPETKVTQFKDAPAYRPLLEPLTVEDEVREQRRRIPWWEGKLDERSGMSATIEILTTPTADTRGTTLVLRTPTKSYVFGSQAEGTQRALTQQGTRLLKAQDFFLTGRAEWSNTGGFVGLMLTLADSSASSFEQAMAAVTKAREAGKTASDPPKSRFNIYGPPNLKHTLATCRRFIFRRGIPISATEYQEGPAQKEEDGSIPPSWQDTNIQVWAMAVSPTSQRQDADAEAELEARRQAFDSRLNTFEDHQAPETESAEDREARYDRIRSATLKYMFDSSWTFDTLVERHISEVQMPAAIFVRNPDTHGYVPYTGPKPGGSAPLPDIKVFTRVPWPGATILALPPTKPAPESISYIVRTLSARGQFDVVRAKVLGVKPGPDFGKLTAGTSVRNDKGEWVTSEQVLGADRPGQGIAILDVPSADYIQGVIQREELVSPQLMQGIGAIVWMLGPGVSGHPALNEFMSKLSSVQHVISSTDVSPNRITYDSVAGQATRLGQIDPSRYSVPVYDNVSIPQKTLSPVNVREATSLSRNAVPADRGLTFVLMPKFVTKKENISQVFDFEKVKEATDAEVLHLAHAAQRAVVASKEQTQAWQQLLARPDTEVTTLGTGSALPSKYRNVSATLVRVPGIGNYLFDCGENTLGQLSRVFPAEELAEILKNLRLIWISHLHADHHLGTASVIRAWYHLRHCGVPRSGPLDASHLRAKSAEYGLSVISHSGMLQWLNEYSSIEDFGYSRILPLEITPNEVGRGSELNILNSFNREDSQSTLIRRKDYSQIFGFTDIQSARVTHCHGAMAVSITFPRSPSDPHSVKPLKVSYSGDCRPSQHFGKIGTDTTVLIHEATFDDELQGDARAKKHSTTSEALGIGAQMNAKAVVLTHFSQRYQKIPILQTVTDGEQEDPLLDPKVTAEEPTDEDEDMDVDPTHETAGNVDIHAPKPSSTPHDNERVIKIRNKDMKVAIAFDYMRVKIGEIIEMEKFNEALNELLVKDKDDEAVEEGAEVRNAKRASEDEKGGSKKKQKGKGKQKEKGEQKEKGKSKRNN